MPPRETKPPKAPVAQTPKETRRGRFGGTFLLQVCESAEEAETLLNDAYDAGFRGLEWSFDTVEREGYQGGPALRFLVWGRRPEPDQCPMCERDLVEDEEEDDTAEPV